MPHLNIAAISRYKISFLFSLFPVFFLPVISDFYDTNKWYLLILTSLYVIMVYVFSLLKTGRGAVSLSPVTLTLGGITLASLASLVLSSKNFAEALLHPLGIMTFSALTILSLIVPPLFSSKEHVWLKIGLYASSSIIGLLSIYQYASLGKVFATRLPFLSEASWTPVGSSYSLLLFVIILLPIIIEDLIIAFKNRRENLIIGLGFVSILSLVGAVIAALFFSRVFHTYFLPFSMGWTIVLDTFKNLRTAFTGFGIENFLQAFVSSKQSDINSTTFWNLRFVTNSTFLFHVTTVYGLCGLAATLLFLKALWPHHASMGYKISATLSIVLLLIAPPSFVLIVSIVLVYMACCPVDENKTRQIQLSANKFKPLFSVVTGFISFSLVVLIACLLGRAYWADMLFYKSSVASGMGNGNDTYNHERQAILLNPYNTRYHIVHSQTNLRLASSLATSAQQNGETISDEDKKTITSLIQQAISEAKLATGLSPNNILAWENLANIYETLAVSAQGADSWAIASYQKAMTLDKFNPLLRFGLGSVYLRQQNLPQALEQFTQASILKPDYANAYYNIGNIYLLDKQYKLAESAFVRTLQLVPVNGPDYEKANNKLTETRKFLTPTQPTQ